MFAKSRSSVQPVMTLSAACPTILATYRTYRTIYDVNVFLFRSNHPLSRADEHICTNAAPLHVSVMADVA